VFFGGEAYELETVGVEDVAASVSRSPDQVALLVLGGMDADCCPVSYARGDG
jgi:hypothetical protein